MEKSKRIFISGLIVCVFNLSMSICTAAEVNSSLIVDFSRNLSCGMTRPILDWMQQTPLEMKGKSDYLLLEAKTLKSLGRFEEAVERYLDFLRLEPESLAAYYDMADCLIELHRDVKIQDTLTLIASKWPNSLELLLLKHKASTRPSESESKKSWEKAISKFQPSSTSEYLRKAHWLKSEGDMDGAIDLYRNVQKLFPREILAYIGEATILTEQKRGRQSTQVADQVLTIENNCGAAFLIKGLNYQMAGNLTEALVNFDKSESLGVESGILYSKRGDVYSKQMMFKEAIADYSAAINRLPKDYNLYWMRAVAYSERQEQRKAYDDICLATSLAGDKCVDCHYIRGRIAYNLNLRKDAIASFEKFLQLSPDNDNRRASVVALLARLSY